MRGTSLITGQSNGVHAGRCDGIYIGAKQLRSSECREIALRAKKSDVGEAKELHLYRGQEIALIQRSAIAVLWGRATGVTLWGQLQCAPTLGLCKSFPSCKTHLQSGCCPPGGGGGGEEVGAKTNQEFKC